MNNTLKIGVFFNTDKKKGKSICDRLLTMLEEYSSSVFLLEYSVKNGIDVALMSKMIQSVDVIFAIGGDGTLLSAQRQVIGTDISIIGINAGRKGFLIELDEDSMEKGIKRYFEGKYYVERRNTLYGCVQNIDTNEIISSDIAINEFSISRNGNTGIIKISIYVNGELMEVFSADGVLISTPTGSTAYSLSAGGPVVMPEVHCTLITPVCAHSLHTRPFITPDDVTIEVMTQYRDGEVLLIADGQLTMKIPEGCKVVIKKADEEANFIRFDSKNKYTEFRDKMLQHID